MKSSGYVDGKILQQAIDLWGIDAQCEMIEEECLELALALQKFKRSDVDRDQKYFNIIDEIADVKIMIMQAIKIFPIDEINKRVDFKMARLADRINSHNKL
jgi:NTP pyrophosphatase (non-canonical NTP hydrolase)